MTRPAPAVPGPHPNGWGLLASIRRIPVPTPFVVGDVNAYLICEDPLTLFDCGPASEQAWAALLEGFRAAGRRPEELRRLVLSHPHQDHAGLAGRLRRLSGCEVFAHPAALRSLGSEDERRGDVEFLLEACRRGGTPPDRLEAIRGGLAEFERYMDPVDGVRALSHGDVLDFAGGALRVLHTPGHTEAALCLWERRSRLLLSGDTLLPHISSIATLEPGRGTFRTEALVAYAATLTQFEALAPRSVLPGHGSPFGQEEGIRELLEGRLGFYDRRAARLRGLIEEGLSTPWELSERLFPGLDPAAAFLGVAEVVGHLDLLAARGEINFQGQQGPWSASPRGTSSCLP